MTRKPTPRPGSASKSGPSTQSDAAAKAAPEGDRIAKVLARAGVASRREAERMIEDGRVSVNGKKIDSPALNVSGADRITVDGKPIGAAEPARLWLYHKPTGLVTTNRDEQGRATIYDELPDTLPRVMSVGRLDLNSEGLLLLTNDGGVKRKLELPSTGWVRKYRVRVKGSPDDATLAPLREGVVVDQERFQPMAVTLDRQQGANAWLTVGLREGKNREIRRAMESIGLVVNRLIRVSYGPFQLGTLKPGAVEEVRPKVLRDQLGLEVEEPEEAPVRRGRPLRRSSMAGKPGRPVQEDAAPRKQDKGLKPRYTGLTGGKPARPSREAEGPGFAGGTGRKTFGTRTTITRRDEDEGGRPGARSGFSKGSAGGKGSSRGSDRDMSERGDRSGSRGPDFKGAGFKGQGFKGQGFKGTGAGRGDEGRPDRGAAKGGPRGGPGKGPGKGPHSGPKSGPRSGPRSGPKSGPGAGRGKPPRRG